MGKPGEPDSGRGVNEALDVINTLALHDIHSCVVGAKALVYYGAHRVPMCWDICVPTASFDAAKTLLTRAPLSQKYDLWHHTTPTLGSLAHTYPHFTLKGINFYFILTPSSDCNIACEPAQFDRSPRGVPYPRLELFAQSLLDTQQYADLADLVDGMDLEESWGEQHLRFKVTPLLVEYIRGKNERITASYEGIGINPVPARLSETPKLRERWRRIVGTKARRINDELPRERHLTRFRKVGSPDPREITDREV
ncbi:hypothetical protein C8A05DRAFT_17938 [Staphylotrichum tortipilum]|uniref:Uncharacterized protein n=1 Tax=Staphylotrichum tortipilum TaxID=2831512 RepID=A0AAN6MGA8_9PEZI|nr:hypothetical protein C8A05DRAFT_17938 [Staphylotrichum longicolle]